jgi:hypothetical protein
MTGWRGWDTSETNLEAEGARSFSLSVALPWRTPGQVAFATMASYEQADPWSNFLLITLIDCVRRRWFEQYEPAASSNGQRECCGG